MLGSAPSGNRITRIVGSTLCRAAALAVVLAVTACGGGGGGSNPSQLDSQPDPDSGGSQGDRLAFPDPLPLRGLDNPSLAYGLNQVADWNPITPFIDIVKTMRGWTAHYPSVWQGMSAAELAEAGYLDEQGWLRNIPPGVTGVTGLFAWEYDSVDIADVRAGRHTLLYRGEGRIDMTNVTVVSEAPGEIVFDVREYPGNWWFTIAETDPEGTGNYIRDISVVRNEQLDLFRVGALFNPRWLSLIEDARQLRFMNWIQTNKSRDERWEDITSPDYYTWSDPAGQEVPLEVQVRLANEVGADPWFNIPHLANDDYVRQFATFVRDHLDPRLRAHVELTNEAWNWQFPQTHELVEAGQALWGNGQVGVYYVKRATEVMQVWDTVFADEAGNTQVWVVDRETMKVHRRKVTTGNLLGKAAIQILDGLKSGETIAVAGVSRLREDMQVRKLEQ